MVMNRILLLLPLAATLGAQPAPDGMVDRYLTAIAQNQLAAREAAIARLRTPADVDARRRYIREKLLEEIGGLPARTPLNARITGTLDRGSYRIEKLIYESLPHYYVTANVYVPAGGRPPYPAMVGTAGHSLDGKADATYQRVWISLARRGFVVLAFDPPGQGERFEYLDPATGKSRLSGGGTGEHIMAGIQCLLTGTNIARYFIWDGMRAVDYLLTRPDVDPRRIAVAGNSGGGTQSSYLAALEDRFSVAAPSCYLTSWKNLWADPGPQDAEQNFAGFLRDGLDFPDFLIAFAPKPIQMSTATRDFFPIAGARATYAEVRSVFGLLNAADHAGYFEFDDTHGWSKPRREATYQWLARWMQERPDDGVEAPDLEVLPPKELQSAPTGQVSTSFSDAATVQSLNAALAEELYLKRSAANGRNLAALVRARLGVPAERGAPAAAQQGDTVEIQPEPGITLHARIAAPSGGPARKPAVLYVGAATEPDPLAITLTVEPRGWTGTAAPPTGYSKPYQTAMRALLVGKTMAGMQTGDIRRAFDYLAARPDVDPRGIRIAGRGAGAVLALYAALLEPRIVTVSCEDMPPSYMELVRMKMHPGVMDLIVPGALRDFDIPDMVAALGERVTKPGRRIQW
jgi:cephalosporin-C deacetylase-like acetyl esterase